MAVMISEDKKELIVTCKCGCQDTIHIKVDDEVIAWQHIPQFCI